MTNPDSHSDETAAYSEQRLSHGEVLKPSNPYGINPRDAGFVDISSLFPAGRPLVLEIGSGKGRYLVESAKAAPEKDFVGIEKSLHYYRVILRKLERFGLENARAVNFDAAVVLDRMFPEESLDEIHIYFPDPWPRRKTKKRRIARETHLRVMEKRMKRDGFGLFVTDHQGYFEEAVPEFEAVFECESEDVPESVEPRTNYEEKYRAEGRPIYQIRFKRR